MSGWTSTSASDQATDDESDESDDKEVGLNDDVETEDSVNLSSDDSLVTDEGPAPTASPASRSDAEGGPMAA